MALYRKLIITLCLLISINNLVQSQIAPDDVFYYIVKEEKQKNRNAFSIKLFVHNASNDSIFISDFNKYIPNISAVNFKKKQERIFYWDLQTLANKEPEDIVSISILFPKSKRQSEEKNVRIAIPAHSTFVSDVYMLFSPFIVYPKGYYKLCLFDNATKKCLAETIIEIK